MAKKLYVGNLPWGTKKEHLESVITSHIEAAVAELKEAGVEVESATIEDNFFKIDERGNARFAIVTISNDDVAMKLIEKMNEMPFDAQDDRGPRNLIVNEARPREERPAGQGSYGSRGTGRSNYSSGASRGYGNNRGGNSRGGYGGDRDNGGYSSGF